VELPSPFPPNVQLRLFGSFPSILSLLIFLVEIAGSCREGRALGAGFFLVRETFPFPMDSLLGPVSRRALASARVRFFPLFSRYPEPIGRIRPLPYSLQCLFFLVFLQLRGSSLVLIPPSPSRPAPPPSKIVRRRLFVTVGFPNSDPRRLDRYSFLSVKLVKALVARFTFTVWPSPPFLFFLEALYHPNFFSFRLTGFFFFFDPPQFSLEPILIHENSSRFLPVVHSLRTGYVDFNS